MTKHNEHQLIAWETDAQTDMPIEPAPAQRDWMDQSNRHFAYRCLPLVIANQSGWQIRNPIGFEASWNGGGEPKDTEIRFPAGRAEDDRVSSHFGHGVVTFCLPYLFRTPPGVNLWVKGPANWIKDGIQPLEGVVETDWTETTFTMNWKLTRTHHGVTFEQGDPICMIVPIPRGLAESLEPLRKPLQRNKKLLRRYLSWKQSRIAFNEAVLRQDEEAVRAAWQRDYMLGLDGEKVPFPEHQKKLSLREFKTPS